MRARSQSGMSLIELMIALTIGLVLLAGLTVVFVNSSKSQRVGQAAAQQNDNARYAIDTLTTDLHHAGYYDEYADYGQGVTGPDPCATTLPSVTDLEFPVQLYSAVMPTVANTVPSNQYPDLTSTSCGGATLLPQKNLMPGSDVLVIRRVDTTPLAVNAVAASGQYYLQTSPLDPEFQTGKGAAITSTSQADGVTAADLTAYNRTAAATLAGPIDQYYVDIYFVAPCSQPKGGGTVCTGANDDGGHPIPTLKMLQLSLNGTSMGFTSYIIAEGIQAMKLELGIDNNPTTANTVTGRIGDGQPDCYEPNATNPGQPPDADVANAVTAKLFLISRAVTSTSNFSDSKYYQMGSSNSDAVCGTIYGDGVTYGQYQDGYMRHGYQSLIRLTNMASRREIP